ncbi:MAG: hypothetical protein AAGU12_08600 [Clostridiales bacterium]
MAVKRSIKKSPVWLDRLIYQSGIAGRLPWFNDKVLLLFLFAAAFLVYTKFSEAGRFIALTYGFIALVALTTFLLLLVLMNKAKLRKSFLSFLTIYSNFYAAEADEIQALEKAADYIEDPFRSIIKRWTAFYKGRKELSFDEALAGILSDTGDEPEVRKFINMTRISHRYGGDYQGLLKKMIRQEQYKEESLAKKASTAALGTGLILFMIMMNLILLFSLLNQAELALFFHSAKGRLHLFLNALATLASIGFVLNINK